MITNYWRVSVDVPQEVWERFGHAKAYGEEVMAATKGSLNSGSNAYSDVEEWAEFCTEKEAKACEEKLKAVMAKFAAIPKEPDDEDQS